MALRASHHDVATSFERLRSLGARKKQLFVQLHQLHEQYATMLHELQAVQQSEDEAVQELGHMVVSATGASVMHSAGIRSVQDPDLDTDQAWKKPRIEPAPHLAPKPDMMQRSAQVKEAQVRVAVQIKASMPDPLETAQGGKNLLRSSVLAGQPLEYRKQGQAVGFGIVAPNNQGTVICKCVECKGRTEVSLSLFEAHSGSTLRRPAEFTFLSNFNISIKDLLSLVNSEEVIERYSKCQLCHTTGDELLRCDKCGCAFHADCLGLSAQGQEDPPCPACVQKASLFLHQPPPTAPYAPGIKAEAAKATSPASLYGLSALPFGDDTPDSLVGNGLPSKDASRVRNKRLFLAGSGLLQEGERVKYVVGDKVMMEGTVCLGDATQPGGIRCSCCSNIISCSAFEQHAGYGSRRAPYDHIITSKGVSLKRLAEMGPEGAKMASLSPLTVTHTPSQSTFPVNPSVSHASHQALGPQQHDHLPMHRQHSSPPQHMQHMNSMPSGGVMSSSASAVQHMGSTAQAGQHMSGAGQAGQHMSPPQPGQHMSPGTQQGQQQPGQQRSMGTDSQGADMGLGGSETGPHPGDLGLSPHLSDHTNAQQLA